jgi:hypothetical protein
LKKEGYAMTKSSYYTTYVKNPFVEKNKFIRAKVKKVKLPSFKAAKNRLPSPFWGRHENTIKSYWRAWEIAFKNIHNPDKKNNFKSPYIDAAFNDCIFLWDSVFMLFFGKYGDRIFRFQETLDNFYASQHPDGFICRELREQDGGEQFHRFDATSTGPNLFAWSEWEFFLNFGDKKRLAMVFPVLIAYHQWLRVYRTWQDGSYWSSGWGCGMDNQPRMGKGYDVRFSHGKLSWVDATFQQLISARILMLMAKELKQEKSVLDMKKEVTALTRLVNKSLWNKKTGFYYDKKQDGTLSRVKSIAAFWSLLSGAAPKDRIKKLIAHLNNKKEFNRPHRVPTLSADDPRYVKTGGYWLGSIWPPTNYMILRGLSLAGNERLAFEIAKNSVDNVVKVFEKTGTFWENYAPEKAEPGDISRDEFVGWSGIFPITMMFEYVFGIKADVPNNKITWDINLLEEHGIEKYPFGKKGLLDLRCLARKSASETPVIECCTNIPITLEIRWDNKKGVVHLKAC